MKNLKTSQKLLVGFGVSVTLVLIIGLVSISSINGINKRYIGAIDAYSKQSAGAGNAAEIKPDMPAAVKEAGNARCANAIIVMIVLTVTSIAVLILFGKYISNIISKPLGDILKMISEMGMGHLSMRIDNTCGDDIGAISGKMDKFADDLQHQLICAVDRLSNGELSMETHHVDQGDELGAMLKRLVVSLKSIVDAIKKISVGDLNMKLEMRNPNDEIFGALIKTTASLHSLIIDDGGKVLQAAADKDLSQRLTGKYEGCYNKMKDNINTVLESLDGALKQVSEAAWQVSNASAQITGESQGLAEGSNEQASSIEEVSSSLEEISAMTKQNADNSNHAKILAQETRLAADEGDVAMRRMATAIHDIKASADNTAKIIKTIDDIAFQTNLLALNAAVEAARAGEAGKGFAVVAEEVRNLAMLSADAAQNTANMIEESVKKADGGVKITEEVAMSLNKIVERAGKVGEIISEIAAASKEQSSGIEHVNVAVVQMSQVTQRDAAISEQCASASQELSDQAAALSEMVRTFKLSDGQGREGDVHNQEAAEKHQRRAAPAPHLPSPRRLAVISDRLGRHKIKEARAEIIPAKLVKAVSAEDIIPLDDDEINEF